VSSGWRDTGADGGGVRPASLGINSLTLAYWKWLLARDDKAPPHATDERGR